MKSFFFGTTMGIVIILVLLVRMGMPFGEAAQKDFRYSNWGDPGYTLKEDSDAELIYEDRGLCWKQYGPVSLDVLGDFMVYYYYTKGFQHLASASYTFIDQGMKNPADYLEAYGEVYKAYVKKYGTPQTDVAKNRKGQTVSVKGWGASKLASAVAKGELKLEATWSLPRTDVSIVMEGRDGYPVISMKYASKEWNSVRKKDFPDEDKTAKDPLI